jgi:hypothetical protein
MVPARKEEAEALREALLLGAWHRHRSGSVVMTAIDRRSRTTQRLGGNAACQWSAGEAAGEGMRRAAHRGVDGAPWRGRGQNFTGGQRNEEQRKGTGLGGHRAP